MIRSFPLSCYTTVNVCMNISLIKSQPVMFVFPTAQYHATDILDLGICQYQYKSDI